MRLKLNSRGESFMSVMMAVAILGVLVLFSASAITQISKTLHHNEDEKRLTTLDTDVSNLLILPQICTCNFAGVDATNISAAQSITQLSFFTDPPTNYNTSSCQNAQPPAVVKVGSVHSASQLTIQSMTLGPFHPLGPLAGSGGTGDMLADFTVQVVGAFRPLVTKILLSTTTSAAGKTTVQFCGKRTGSAPLKAPTAYGGNYYRYSQFSLNFGCPKPFPWQIPTPSHSFHPAQVEPYIFSRNQYFWPVEEGDFISEFEVGRMAQTPLPPWQAATVSPFAPGGGNTPPPAFSGSSVCFKETAVSDSAELLVPATNQGQCSALKNNFLNTTGKVIDVGFSLVDNCESRIYQP